MEIAIQITLGEIGLIFGSIFLFWVFYKFFNVLFIMMVEDLNKTNK